MMKMLMVLALAASAAMAGEPRSGEVTGLLDEVLEGLLERDPVTIGPAIGDDRYNDRLPDHSPEAYAAWRERQASWLERARAIDRAGLGERDLLDLDLLEHRLSVSLAGADLYREQMPITSISGPQVWLAQLGDRVPLTRRGHYEDYLSRLEQIPVLIGAQITQMNAGIDAGRVQPAVVMAPTVEQAMAQATPSIEEDPASSPFYKPFLRLEQDDPLAVRARAVIRDEIVPVYRELAVYLANVYLPSCRETTAAVDGVDGIRAYEVALREYTTLSLSADEIHEIGLAEVARIREEMFEVIARTDFGAASSLEGDELFEAFTAYLREDPRFFYEDAEALLDGYRAMSKLVDAEMPRLFGLLPRLPYGVRPIPLFAAKSSPTAYYYPGSLEGGVPGYFMANTYNLRARPKWGMVPLTLHEAVPGHHHQIALSQELEDQHPIRGVDSVTAFVEGWALYAERLGLEMGGGERGLYEDPYDDFGRLTYEMWRAMRLVVDTGLHAKRWTRREAIEYMMSNSPMTEPDVTAEVDRYIGWPGQACAYKLGELKIRELRARAESALGDRFDIRAFHDAVLSGGGVPLPVLESKIDRWIESRG